MGWNLYNALTTYENAARSLFDLGEPLPLVVREAYSLLLHIAITNRLTNPHDSSPAFAAIQSQGTIELERLNLQITDTWQCVVHLVTIDLILTNISLALAAAPEGDGDLLFPLLNTLCEHEYERKLRMF